MPARTFLFLQGLASPFMHRLGRRLRDAGHRVLRINVSGADLVAWPGRAINFRGREDEWPAFLARTLESETVTDIVLFGDCRPLHRAAIEQARPRGIATHILEEGYFRPNWITLEHGGSNGYSTLPRDPQRIAELARTLPDPEPVTPLSGCFFNRALWDVAANVCGAVLWPMFPHYRWHGTDHPFVEYAGWLYRFARTPLTKAQTRRTVKDVVEAGRPYYLAPLQLHSDYQLRVHSPFAEPIDAVEAIMQSFRRHAPPGTHLLFKLHPLDNTLYGYRGKIARLAARLAIAKRIHLIDEWDVPTLLKRSRGVVLVNSSIATVAFDHGCAVKALGTAIYDIPGLAYQGPLDTFWTEATPPDAALFRAYRTVVLALTQVNGGFFTRKAVEIGTRGAAERILAVGPTGSPTASPPTD
jgi:capsular polysaccharide export protein